VDVVIVILIGVAAFYGYKEWKNRGVVWKSGAIFLTVLFIGGLLNVFT